MNKLMTTSTLGLAGLVPPAGAWSAYRRCRRRRAPATGKRSSATTTAGAWSRPSTTTMTTTPGSTTRHRTRGHQHQRQHRHPDPATARTPTPGTPASRTTTAARDRPRDRTRDGPGNADRDHSQHHTNDGTRHNTRVTRPSPRDTWGFAEGDAITAELTAVRRLGGGSAYEAYLAFDEITYAPVVVKVRPTRPGRRRVTACAACAARSPRSATVNHPVVVRGLRHDLDGRAPARGARAASTGPGCRR